MAVPETPVAQKPAPGLAVKSGVVPGAGDGADIHQPLHPVGSEQLQEILQGAGGVTHGENNSAEFPVVFSQGRGDPAPAG